MCDESGCSNKFLLCVHPANMRVGRAKKKASSHWLLDSHTLKFNINSGHLQNKKIDEKK